MKILLIHPHDIYSDAEPWTVRIRSIAKEFVKRGHSVKLIHFPLNSDEITPPFFSDGYEVISLSRRYGTKILLKNILKVCQIADWADIVHFQKCFHYAALPALIASLIKNKPVHYDWDDWEIKIYYYSPKQSRFIGFFLNTWETLIPKLTDTVTVSSQRLYERCIELGVRSERLGRAHVGADLELFHPGIDGSGVRKRYNINSPLVLYLGQLHGGQYAELFLKAAKIILRQFPKVDFMVVGGGYRLDELKQLASSLDLNKVIFTGTVPHNITNQYIAAADICVACFEDNEITRCKSPLKIVEYLASGKAIVASNVGEVRNMVGGAGILVEPGDPKALAEGIIRIIRDEHLRHDMQHKARLRAETKYNWSVTAENLLEKYKLSLEMKIY